MTVSERAWVKMYREDAVREQKRRCVYCREPLPMRAATADHKVPRKAGGGTHRKNIAAACEPCNQTKGDMGEQAYRNLIKNPPSDASLYVLLANSRYRIWTRTWKACRRIMKSVGQSE